MSEIRFSLAERTPGAIKTTGESGTSINVLDEARVKTILNEIHNVKVEDHADKVNWALLTYTATGTNTLQLVGSGTGGLPELRSQTFSDTNVYYALLRVVDDNEGVKTNRFVYITFVGDGVSGFKKAKFGVNKTAVTELIGHYSVEVLVSKRSELTDETILSRVGSASGSQNKTSDPSPVMKSNSTHSSDPSSYIPKATSAELCILNEDEAKNIVQEVRKGTLDWVALGYSTPNQLSVIGKGSGGLNELKAILEYKKASYAFLSVNFKVDATEMKRFIYIRWVPDGVPALSKGKITPHRGFVEDWFAPFHVVLNAAAPNELTERIINAKLAQLKIS